MKIQLTKPIAAGPVWLYAVTVMLIMLLPTAASALRINDTDIGTPPAASSSNSPQGFRAAQGWTVYWGSSCEEARVRNALWKEACNDAQITFLSRRKLDMLVRTGKTGGNYLPFPFNGGFLSYTTKGKLAMLTLYFDPADFDVVKTLISDEMGSPKANPPNNDAAKWQAGKVEAFASVRNGPLNQGRLSMIYLPLSEKLVHPHATHSH